MYDTYPSDLIYINDPEGHFSSLVQYRYSAKLIPEMIEKFSLSTPTDKCWFNAYRHHI
jgi:hypothetical protein